MSRGDALHLASLEEGGMGATVIGPSFENSQRRRVVCRAVHISGWIYSRSRGWVDIN